MYININKNQEIECSVLLGRLYVSFEFAPLIHIMSGILDTKNILLQNNLVKVKNVRFKQILLT